jgi:putative nucleotidyltransferase with HDIG domain
MSLSVKHLSRKVKPQVLAEDNMKILTISDIERFSIYVLIASLFCLCVGCAGPWSRQEQVNVALNDRLIEEMKSYFGDKQRLVDHTLAVYGYANQLHKKEGGDPLLVKAGALYHDIGIPEAKRVHGSSAGKYQEIEGPPIAQRILNKLEVTPESVDHICRIIANHHTAHDESTVSTIEFQIVWDADGLVNHAKRKLGNNNKEIIQEIERLFRTPTGRQMAKELFIKN